MVFIPSQELRITRYPCLNEENLNISELVKSSLAELIEEESASVKRCGCRVGNTGERNYPAEKGAGVFKDSACRTHI